MARAPQRNCMDLSLIAGAGLASGVASYNGPYFADSVHVCAFAKDLPTNGYWCAWFIAWRCKRPKHTSERPGSENISEYDGEDCRILSSQLS